MPPELLTDPSSSGVSETQPPTTPTAPSPTEPQSGVADFRIPNDPSIPEWLRGKTPQEIAGITQQLVTYASTSASAAGGGVGYTPAPADTSGTLAAPDPYLAQTSPEEYQRQLDAYLAGQMQRYAQPFQTQQAETARALSRMGRFADVWKRWEPEIEGMLAGVPMHSRSQQMYDTAAQVVRGNHVDELANEVAERRLAAHGSTGSERGTGANGGIPTPRVDVLDEFFESNHPFVVAAKGEGVTAQTVREHCARMKLTPEEYVTNAKHGTVIQTRHGWDRR